MRLPYFCRWLAALAGLAVLPVPIWAQYPGMDYEVPPEANPTVPLPLLHDRPETGGLFVYLQFLNWHQSRHMSDQVVAYRGFIDSDGSLSGVPGTVFGSKTQALRTDQLGRTSFMPGYEIGVGYRFENGVTLTMDYKHLFEAKYTGGATLVPPFFRGPADQSDTFLFAPVFNFPPDYAGPTYKLGGNGGQLASPTNPYGIWNGATTMNILFTQRFDTADIKARIPIFQNEYSRYYGLAGGRWAHFWERFLWRTVSLGSATAPPVIGAPTVQIIQVPTIQPDGTYNVINTVQVTGTTPAPTTPISGAAIYTNIVSNNMYGPFCGCGVDCYLGKNFAIQADVTGAMLIDIVKERAAYELDTNFNSAGATVSKRGRTEYNLVPQFDANVNLMWYPIQGVQMKVGYNLLGFFNTIGSTQPIDFNFGALDPPYERNFLRTIHGLNVGLSLIF